jgi:repressor LexA
MSLSLTSRQQEILDFIQGFIAKEGYPPSLREIGDHFGVKAPSVLDHLRALERKGYLRRKPSRSRSLEMLAWGKRVLGPGTRQIPIVGRVAAGEPILAVENLEGSLPVSEDWVGEGEAFLLKVRGDSMIGAHIQDGDYALVRRQPSAQDGEIVVALVEDEATIKRFFLRREFILLQPENEALEPMVVKRDDPSFQIVGKVIGVFRRL